MADRSSSHPGTPGGSSRRSRPSPTSTPTRRVQHRLRHRPRQQRRVRLDRLGRPVEVRQRAAVALEQQPSALDHRDGVGGAVALLVGEHLVDHRPRGPAAGRRWATRRWATAHRRAVAGAGAAGDRRRRPPAHGTRLRRGPGLSCRSGRRRGRPRRWGCPSTARCRGRSTRNRPRSTTTGAVRRDDEREHLDSRRARASGCVRRPPGGISMSWRLWIAERADRRRGRSMLTERPGRGWG